MAYLEYAQQTGDLCLSQLDSTLEAWGSLVQWTDDGHYKGRIRETYLAALFANLYELTRNEVYVAPLIQLLLVYDEPRLKLPSSLPKRVEYGKEVPAIIDFFLFPKYCRAYEVAKKSDKLSKREQTIIEGIIAESAEFTLITQEWGPMNRSMLRAEGLLYASKLLPDHPNQSKWKQYGNALITDNFDNWSIEDASMYQLIWMYSACSYAMYVKEDASLLRRPQFHYYFEYIKQLYSPLNTIPGFGDSRWKAWSQILPPVLELGSALFDDKELKWLAQEFWGNQPKKLSIDKALKMTEACLWGDFILEPEMPDTRSTEVLDDQIGKKVVFRSGWQDPSTYLLLNYKDEGDGGWLYRQNLRNTLSVSHEKAHHGHADENSIVSLVRNGSVLLKDGGYRDRLPSGDHGSFRADIFHNRLVWRNGLLKNDDSVLESLKNDGFYHPVNTQKIDFVSTRLWDMSRTRVIDKENGIQHDRIINYLTDIDAFIIFDVVECLEKNTTILANLWHTQYVSESGRNWFLTRYGSVGKWKNPGGTKLLIHFPLMGNTTLSKDEITRSKQPELVISNAQSYTFEKGDIKVFTTVLFPVEREDPHQLVSQVSAVNTSENAIALSIIGNGKEYTVGHKLDLSQDLVRKWPKPRYTWVSGKCVYGSIATDGHAVFSVESKDSLSVTSIGTTRIDWRKQTLFQQPAVTNEYRVDGGPATNAPWKVRYIERTIKK